jgi:hypothetical protein
VRDDIEARLAANLARVRAIVSVYEERAGGRGRQRVETVDLLRAAVVFLHATMEDVLRSALEWKWPETASAEHLQEVPMLGHNRGRRVELADLLPHRGTSVDDLIRRSIEAHLERASFNNVGDVKRAIERLGLDVALVTLRERHLAAVIARRHEIVHRADRSAAWGPGHHVAASLRHATVAEWFDAVEAFCTDFVARL